jgi:N-acetylmuramoyl-L-alanine amidase
MVISEMIQMTHSPIPTLPSRIPWGLPAGNTGKKSLLAAFIIFLILCLSLALSLSPSTALAAGFSDLKGNWAAPEIAKAVDAGYIKGYPDGRFKPAAGVTRAEFLTMVDNAFQLAAAQNPGTFRDVRPGAWFGSSVQAAVYSGLVSGYPDHTFRPQQAVTRQEAACILAPLLKLQEDGALRFTDTRQIAAWAKPSVSQLAVGGIITGYPDGTFRPEKIISRAEAVAIINKALTSRTVVQTPAPGRGDQGVPVVQTPEPGRGDTGELAVDVSHDQYGEKVDITVVQGAVYNVAELQDPQRLVITVPGVTVVRTPLEIPVGEGGLDKVTTNFSGTGPGTAEVEISFATPGPLTYYTTPGQSGELQITVPPQIYKIEATPVSDFLAVNLWATGPLNYQTSMQGNPQQLVLYFPGIGLSPGLLNWQQQVSAAGVDGLQFSEPQPITAQLAVQTKQDITCSSDSSNQGQQMVLRLRENTNPAGQSGQGVQSGLAGQGNLAGKCIVLDPGHGGNDPGAIGPHGVEEKWVTLPIALKAADILRQQGANVIMTRTVDANPDLLARPELANDNNADVFVSIHANWIRNSSIGGTGTYTYAPPGTPLGQQRTARLHLASCLQDDLVKTLGLHDSGVIEDNFAVLRCTTMPAALVEVAFISNSWEERLLGDSNFQQQAAAAIASGITRFLTGG